ncbi:MAG: hypothetical protein KDE58_42795, partial [Caldilineaceae bacterium]|nr:hypothetical protein [Caldilineaceae bacterium]
MRGHHMIARKIVERIHINGTLVLETPAHFGSGQVRGDSLVDMSLLLDDADGSANAALLPGTTIAGALRNYLRERLHGYECPESDRELERPIAWLFGPTRQSEQAGDQSLLIVDDAYASQPERTLRDGVRIDEKSGIAYKDERGGAKFDVELLEAGTAFNLHFELLVTERHSRERLLPYIVAALQGFEEGSIRLGLRKRRGYGQCRVSGWQVSSYRMTDRTELCQWLDRPTGVVDHAAPFTPIAEALKTPAIATDRRNHFSIQATFGLPNSSLLIRSGFGEADTGPDVVHLHGRRGDQRVPIISGTSWAGVVRHRALRIAKTIATAAQQESAAKVVKDLFGRMPKAQEKRGRASRTTFDETEVKDGQSLYQTRIRIDRFTGGAFEGALFEQAPVYGTAKTRIGFALHLRNPTPAEIGLFLLVLKDLWTGDLPIGGEASVGRGRLQGHTACLRHRYWQQAKEGETERLVTAEYILHVDQLFLGLS